jgi:hypothetical protein
MRQPERVRGVSRQRQIVVVDGAQHRGEITGVRGRRGFSGNWQRLIRP